MKHSSVPCMHVEHIAQYALAPGDAECLHCAASKVLLLHFNSLSIAMPFCRQASQVQAVCLSW